MNRNWLCKGRCDKNVPGKENRNTALVDQNELEGRG